jgi:hypothetical protein
MTLQPKKHSFGFRTISTFQQTSVPASQKISHTKLKHSFQNRVCPNVYGGSQDLKDELMLRTISVVPKSQRDTDSVGKHMRSLTITA